MRDWFWDEGLCAKVSCFHFPVTNEQPMEALKWESSTMTFASEGDGEYGMDTNDIAALVRV